MDYSKNLPSLFKQAGLMPIKVSTTRIRGYNRFSRGDYLMYTEKSFGLYDLRMKDRMRKIECNEDKFETIKEIVVNAGYELLDVHGGTIITTVEPTKPHK